MALVSVLQSNDTAPSFHLPYVFSTMHRRSQEFILGVALFWPEGPKVEAESREQGGVLGRGQRAPSYQVGSLGKCCKLPIVVPRPQMHFGRTKSTKTRWSYRKYRLVPVSRFYLVFGALPVLDSWGAIAWAIIAPMQFPSPATPMLRCTYNYYSWVIVLLCVRSWTANEAQYTVHAVFV